MLLFLILLCLPFQVGKHFWPDIAFVTGIRVDYLSPTLFLTDILLFLLLILVVVNNVPNITQKKLRSLFGKKLFWATCFLFVSLFISAFLSIRPMLSIMGIVRILEALFFGWYVFYSINKKQVSFVFILIPLSLGVLFESFLGFGQYINQGSLGGALYFFGERTFTSQTPGIANVSLDGQLTLRPYGTLSHPNLLAAYLFVCLYLLIVFLTTQVSKNILWWFFLVSFLVGSFGLFLTLSRVVICCYLIVVIFFLLKKHLQKKIWFVTGILPLFLVIIFTTPLSSRFLSISLIDQSVTLRLALLAAAQKLFFSYPLFGVGYSQFLVWLPQVLVYRGSVFILQPVHNAYLLLLTEIGIVGFLPVLFLIIALCRYVISKNTIFIPLLFSILFLCFFDHYFLTIEQGRLLLALVIGLCLFPFKSFVPLTPREKSSKRKVVHKLSTGFST